MGRKTKLTPEVQAKVCALLRAGNYFDASCQAAGITEQTGYNWINRGESACSGKFFDFFEAVKRASAEGEAANVTVIKIASEKHWTAAAWLLERRFPGKWGRRVQEINAKVEHDIVDGTDEERIDRIAEMLERARARRDRSASE